MSLLVEAFRSFWVFDAFRPYSINFVWGPQIAFTATDRAALYDTLPPVFLSGTFVILSGLLIILALICAVSFSSTHQNRLRWITTRFSIVLLIVWIVFDIRMGSEFLSWVWTDHTTYIAANTETRTFRERKRFYDFAEAVAPIVADRQSYIFFAEQPWPYLGNMRYITYPSIPGIDIAHDDTWVVYRRPDMTVDANGQITIEGEAISGPGKVLLQFDDISFVFRAAQ